MWRAMNRWRAYNGRSNVATTLDAKARILPNSTAINQGFILLGKCEA
jgi:hypothetical protein